MDKNLHIHTMKYYLVMEEKDNLLFVTKSCHIWLCNTVDSSTSGFPFLPAFRACSNSCPSSRWCHPTTSSSAVHFFFCPQSFPAPESFPMSRLFASGSQSTGPSASHQFFPNGRQLIYAITWLNFMLNEKDWHKKLHTVWFHLHEMLGKIDIIY